MAEELSRVLIEDTVEVVEGEADAREDVETAREIEGEKRTEVDRLTDADLDAIGVVRRAARGRRARVTVATTGHDGAEQCEQGEGSEASDHRIPSHDRYSPPAISPAS